MREAAVEKALRLSVEKRGGRAYKFVSPGNPGVPDRLCVLPGRVRFVELKAPGERPEPHQVRILTDLQALGLDVSVLDSPDAVKRWSNRPMTRARAYRRLLAAINRLLAEIGTPHDRGASDLAIELEKLAIAIEARLD